MSESEKIRRKGANERGGEIKTKAWVPKENKNGGITKEKKKGHGNVQRRG